jgi:hypothetical protein
LIRSHTTRLPILTGLGMRPFFNQPVPYGRPNADIARGGLTAHAAGWIVENYHASFVSFQHLNADESCGGANRISIQYNASVSTRRSGHACSYRRMTHCAREALQARSA